MGSILKLKVCDTGKTQQGAMGKPSPSPPFP